MKWKPLSAASALTLAVTRINEAEGKLPVMGDLFGVDRRTRKFKLLVDVMLALGETTRGRAALDKTLARFEKSCAEASE